MLAGEHEVLVGSQNQAPVDQPEDDKNIVKKVNELLSRSKKYRKRYDSEWHSNYEFVCNGKQWPMDRPRWRFSEVVNITWSTIMTEIAIQTDSRPKFEFLDPEPGDIQFTKILEDINSQNWEKYHWSSVVQDALFDCKLYHVAHSIIEWDPELEYGLGDVSYKSLDPFYCYWDPMASDVNSGRKARWFIYAEPVPTSMLKLKYPDFADKMKPDVNTVGQSKGTAQGPNTIYINFDPYSPSRLPSSATASGEIYGGEPMTVFIRAWLRDDTMEELCEETDEMDPETGEKKKEYILKKKYPKGRYLEIACNQKLRDVQPGVEIKGEWVEYEDDSFPIVRLVNYSYAREYCGENEVTHIKGPQKITNYVLSYILDMFKMQANPVTVIQNGGVDEETVTNEPGSIVHENAPGAYRREPGTSITPGSFDLLQVTQTLLDKVQGLQDVQRGIESSAITSQVMMDGYLEASQTRPRMKNRNLDFYLQSCGQLALKRMLQFYKTPRIFRMTAKEGYPEYIEFYIPEDENGQKVAKITRLATTPDGAVAPISTQQVGVKGCPDVRVRSGSNLPYAKAQKSQLSMQNFQAGLIDQEEALKAQDWPNWETVVKRMEEKAAADAEAQAQVEAQQGAK
jgi:hypothetical protein